MATRCASPTRFRGHDSDVYVCRLIVTVIENEDKVDPLIPNPNDRMTKLRSQQEVLYWIIHGDPALNISVAAGHGVHSRSSGD